MKKNQENINNFEETLAKSDTKTTVRSLDNGSPTKDDKYRQ